MNKFCLAQPNDIKEHLAKWGYVIITGILKDEEVKNCHNLFWDHIEATYPNITRYDSDSWYNSAPWPGSYASGVMSRRFIGHSDLQWYIRSNENVRKAFGTVWDTTALITSFDGVGAFRPWSKNIDWKTTDEPWYHVDQSSTMKGLQCIQGLVALTNSNESTGGLS